MAAAGHEPGDELVEVVLDGEPLRGFSMALLVGHDGWSLIDSEYDAPYTVGWLAEQLRTVQGEGTDDYPPVDDDGAWVITRGGHRMDGVALVMVAFDSGAVAAARVPDTTGLVRSPREIIDALHEIQTHCLEDLLLERPAGDER